MQGGAKAAARVRPAGGRIPSLVGFNPLLGVGWMGEAHLYHGESPALLKSCDLNVDLIELRRCPLSSVGGNSWPHGPAKLKHESSHHLQDPGGVVNCPFLGK